MIDDAAVLTIGEVAREAGMRASRIRYYESVGVLPEPERVSGMRRYPPDVVRRLGIIDVAQRVGFTLDEIRELLSTEHGTAHEQLRRLAERKLPEIDELIHRANAVRRWLEMTSACDCRDARRVQSVRRPRSGSRGSGQAGGMATSRPRSVAMTAHAPTDTLERGLRDLRISVTDRCNFRCTYCMPKEVFGRDYAFLPRAELLSFEEITRLARVFAEHGVTKVRLTGGEPLLRRDLERLVEMLAGIDGIADVALTTNGAALAAKARSLKDAGLTRVTVSLDALDDEPSPR